LTENKSLLESNTISNENKSSLEDTSLGENTSVGEDLSFTSKEKEKEKTLSSDKQPEQKSFDLIVVQKYDDTDGTNCTVKEALRVKSSLILHING
jgi:hypothetical protein